MLGLTVLTSGWSADRIFPPDAVVDVTLPPYSATPGDTSDDTDALQRAITDHVGTGRTLYFPPGTYHISRPLEARDASGKWEAHLTLQGAGREATVLKLIDEAAGFNDPAKPLAVLTTGSHFEPGDAEDGGGNKAFRNNVFDLTIDTGRGNPGAVGVNYAVSNIGAIRRVTIRSGDGTGSAGIAMRRIIPGPGFIKDVTIEGFDHGLDIRDIQYGVTLEDVTVRDQRVAGIHCGDNLLHIRRLHSTNRVSAIVVSGRNGALTLVESRLEGGDGDQPAIQSEGTVYLDEVETEGYHPAALRWRGQAVEASRFSEWSGPSGAERPGDAFALEVRETPEFWNSDLDDWVAVGARREGEPDDTAAIQRALHAGKGTVYFRNDRVYFLSDTVTVPPGVRHVLGMGAEINLGAAEEPFSDRANPRPLIRIEGTTSHPIIFENLFFNAQYPGEVIFENASPGTVVFRHCAGWVGHDGARRSYRNTTPGRGEVFIEDCFLPGWEFRDQDVWARQFNLENWDGDGSEAQVHNIGGRLWVLGFKTEGPAPFIETSHGGRTELLGAYNYLSAAKATPLPKESVPYVVRDGLGVFTFVTEQFREGDDYQNYLSGSWNDVSEEIPHSRLPPRNGHDGDRSAATPRLWMTPESAGTKK